LTRAVGEIAREEGAKLAVAFWGRGSLGLVSESAKIICNLKMGGSNPHELQKIEGKLAPGNLRQCDTLHAKVYLGRTRAVITSANASANGLGLEDGEQAGWVEAGAAVSDVAAIHKWFDGLWEDRTKSRSIEAGDWDAAKAAWKARQRRNTTLCAFSDFDVTQARLPMLLTSAHPGWDYNEKALSESGNAENKTLRDRIYLSVEVSNQAELSAMESRWYLYWEQTSKSPYTPKKRQAFRWTFIGTEFLEYAFKWHGSEYYSDALMPTEEQPSEPFDPNTPEFTEAFCRAIMHPEFDELRSIYYDPEWYRKVEKLLPAFWAAVKKEYEAKS